MLRYREVLANILKYALDEYADYPTADIMNFIEDGSISFDTPVAPVTDIRITGDDTVKSSVNEANVTFDVLFNVLLPIKSKVHLHIDVELQGEYNQGYKLEKRGIYNLSRVISIQLDVVTGKTTISLGL